MLTFHIITLFPESFASYLESSIIGRARRQKKIRVQFYNPRDFITSKNRHKPVDDRPYGGGPGMVMLAEPILRTAARILSRLKPKTYKLIIFSPSGKQFTNALAGKWSRFYRHLILICGRYEGIDARVKKILRVEELSIGPYILSGGELPALIVLEAVSRQLSGVLGKDESVEERRVSSPEVYTRPAVLTWRGKKYHVPKILLSGHHGEIKKWKRVKRGAVDKSN